MVDLKIQVIPAGYGHHEMCKRLRSMLDPEIHNTKFRPKINKYSPNTLFRYTLDKIYPTTYL